MDLMNEFLCLIKDDSNEQFAERVVELKLTIIRFSRTKRGGAYKWVEKLPLYCTLGNRYEMLKEVRKHLMEIHKFQCNTSFGIELHVTDLAKALGYHECVEELRQIYINGPHDTHHACKDHGPQDFQLFEGVLKTAKHYNEDAVQPIIDTLYKLCKNGFDITVQGHNGRTALHVAIVSAVCLDIIQTIVKLGGDMNRQDKLGHSPFMLCLLKDVYRRDKHAIVSLLKLWLYQNPDVLDMNKLDTQAVIKCDRMFRSNLAMGVGIHLKSKKTYNDFLMPLLHEAGCSFEQSEADDISDLLPDTNKPRDLKQLARLRIRQTYPGMTLHTTLKQAFLPASIRDYILMEDLNIT